jgi:hypothetical protein
MSEPDEAAKRYREAREEMAHAAVQKMILYLRGADAAIATHGDISPGVERITDVLLAEGWV